MGLREAKMMMEIAVVGPEIRCNEDPNNAATIGTTMAVYIPYSGGSPAIIAKATPWGKTMTAPVNPAIRSALVVSQPMKFHQRRKGKRFRQKVMDGLDRFLYFSNFMADTTGYL